MPANADPVLAERIDRASRDAASLAGLHEFPLLLFPTLFAEKLDEARRHAVLQRFVLHRSSPLTAQF
ncbi:MAG TPA: hypothetical protein VK968_12385 [Roseimicrobium sp.]|nr:hypothetical protein [Roseimicrobium sp.]